MFECNRKERFKCLQINKKEDYKNLIDIKDVVKPQECRWYPPNTWFYKSEYGIDRTPITPGDWLIFIYDKRFNQLFLEEVISNEEFFRKYSIIEEDESCFNV